MNSQLVFLYVIAEWFQIDMNGMARNHFVVTLDIYFS